MPSVPRSRRVVARQCREGDGLHEEREGEADEELYWMQSLLGHIPDARVGDDVAHGHDSLEHTKRRATTGHLHDVADQRQEQRGQARVRYGYEANAERRGHGRRAEGGGRKARDGRDRREQDRRGRGRLAPRARRHVEGERDAPLNTQKKR